MENQYQIGQVWSYHAAPGFESSRVQIGAIDELPEVGEIICVILTDAPLPGSINGGELMAATIDFIPIAREALDASVVELTGEDTLPENFGNLLENWQEERQDDDYLAVPIPVFLDMLAVGMRRD